jgi:hypothetical protein
MAPGCRRRSGSSTGNRHRRFAAPKPARYVPVLSGLFCFSNARFQRPDGARLSPPRRRGDRRTPPAICRGLGALQPARYVPVLSGLICFSNARFQRPNRAGCHHRSGAATGARHRRFAAPKPARYMPVLSRLFSFSNARFQRPNGARLSPPQRAATGARHRRFAARLGRPKQRGMCPF